MFTSPGFRARWSLGFRVGGRGVRSGRLAGDGVGWEPGPGREELDEGVVEVPAVLGGCPEVTEDRGVRPVAARRFPSTNARYAPTHTRQA